MSLFHQYLDSAKDMNMKHAETFNFISKHYNVSLAKNLIRESIHNNDGKVDVGSIDVEEWADMISKKTPTGKGSYVLKPGIFVNDKHAKNKKLNRPLIAVEDGDLTIIIDGWHRLRKAQMEGIKTLPAYLISDKEMLGEINL